MTDPNAPLTALWRAARTYKNGKVTLDADVFDDAIEALLSQHAPSEGHRHSVSVGAETQFTEVQPAPYEGLREDVLDAIGAIGYAIDRMPKPGGRMTQAAERRLTSAMELLDAALARQEATDE